MNEEQQTDEALKADESQIEVESPVTEEVPVVEQGEEIPEVSTEAEVVEGAPRENNRKTADSRIRELVAEKKEAEARAERAESMADQVKKMMAPQDPPPYVPQSQEGDEVTVDEVMRRADSLVQIRLAQQNNMFRIINEVEEASKSHPELNPESDSFNEDLSNSISQATQAYIKANPTAPVKEFVNSLMKPYKRAVEKEASGRADVISKQASQQATRPTQVREQERPFSELSIEEMEKRLEKVYK